MARFAYVSDIPSNWEKIPLAEELKLFLARTWFSGRGQIPPGQATWTPGPGPKLHGASRLPRRKEFSPQSKTGGTWFPGQEVFGSWLGVGDSQGNGRGGQDPQGSWPGECRGRPGVAGTGVAVWVGMCGSCQDFGGYLASPNSEVRALN